MQHPAVETNGTAGTDILRIARQGHFWVGVERRPGPAGTVARGAMHVFYQIPADDARRGAAIVMVHGGGGQGLDFLTTPDGRPGWAEFFLRQGYDIYVVDRPGMGRSPYHADEGDRYAPGPSYEMMRALMLFPEDEPHRYPLADRHDQWPAGEEVVDQFMAGQGPLPPSLAQAQADMRRCGAMLLDRIGPAILLTHSMGGAFGWVVADERPDLVRGIVAVEPIGPPFMELSGLGRLDWGLTAVPLTYDPPAAGPSDLQTVDGAAPGPNGVACLLQAGPARRLPNLTCPIAVVSAEASWMAPTAHGVADYLKQAGVDAEHIRLEDRGVHGNGHMMMLERNSDAIAALIAAWMADRLGEDSAREIEPVS